MNEKPIEYWIELARKIAIEAHEGQTRNDGSPYIAHPLRVASTVEDRLKPIAFLHDTIEDCNITIEDLKDEGFPQYILATIELLTHKPGDPNIIYWNKILTNPDAVIVKIADIKDNLSDNPSDRAREKYTRALELFRKNGVLI